MLQKLNRRLYCRYRLCKILIQYPVVMLLAVYKCNDYILIESVIGRYKLRYSIIYHIIYYVTVRKFGFKLRLFLVAHPAPFAALLCAPHIVKDMLEHLVFEPVFFLCRIDLLFL